MRRVTLTVVAVLLAVPAAASGKVGVEYRKDPAEARPGEAIPIRVMILREPKDPMMGEMQPIAGARPVVTFTDPRGRIVRARAGRSDANGIATGSVRFPDVGPWTGTMRVPGHRLAEHGGNVGTVEVGTALDGGKVLETVGPPAVAPAGSPAASSGIWIGWILLGGAVSLAGLGFTAVRAGVPERLRARLGGGA